MKQKNDDLEMFVIGLVIIGIAAITKLLTN